MSVALGQTASITLLTAIPGSGKTLRLVWWITEAIKRGELVYVCNVNGLKIDGVIPWDDPTDWQSLPPGSVLVVDEAQKYFRARRSGEPPKYITAMETIRHEGVRLILATQQPNYLDAHLRGLVGLHEHMKRVEGKEQATIYRDNEAIEDVRSKTMHIKYDFEVWPFPIALYSCYDSAQVHTVGKVPSSKMQRWKKIFVGMGVALTLGVGLVVWKISTAGDVTGTEPRSQLAATGEPSAFASFRSTEAKEPPLTTEEYLSRLVPRMVEAPYSAPIFDDREAVSEPDVYCMSSVGDGDANASCTCLTEQGTRYRLDPLTCVTIARHGAPYNPFKALPDSQEFAAPPVSESETGKPVGLNGDPGAIGSGREGEMWGKKPLTL